MNWHIIQVSLSDVGMFAVLVLCLYAMYRCVRPSKLGDRFLELNGAGK